MINILKSEPIGSLRWSGLAIPFMALSSLTFIPPAWSCELADMATAEAILGPQVIDTTVDPASFCNFVSATTAASFSVRVDTSEVYDQISIPMPHTIVDIGDRARYHEYPEGGAAVQFVTGDVSVTLAVRTPNSSDEREYLGPLLEAAETAAAKLD